jgi:quinol-cytochrome oxidoreductase complex cytochrome b subunit
MTLESRIVSASADISGGIAFIVLGAMFASFMLFFLLPLVFFSTKESRKRPVFYLSIASILLGCIEGFMLTHFYVRILLHVSLPC